MGLRARASVVPVEKEPQASIVFWPLHAQARLLDEPSGNLAEHAGTQAAQTRQFSLGFLTCATTSWRSLRITIAPWPNPSSGPQHG